MLRFEIERDLLEDRVRVEELPQLWRDKMKSYLGIVPPTDREGVLQDVHWSLGDRKSTRLNSSHGYISYAVFCLKKKKPTICRKEAAISTRARAYVPHRRVEVSVTMSA